MLERKSKAREDAREEKQSYRGCQRGKAKLQRMTKRKSKVTKDEREDKQSDRG